MSEATNRLLELKKKLLSKAAARPSVESAPIPDEQPALPAPVPRPLTKPAEEESAEELPQQKQPLTLRSLMGSRKKSSIDSSAPSRLKEAPAHRAAMLEESKTNIIRSKMISLNNTSSVSEKIAHFEQNPPAAMLAPPSSINPFSSLNSAGTSGGSIFPIFAKPVSREASPLSGGRESSVHPFASLMQPRPVEEQAVDVVAIKAQVPDKSEDVVKFIQAQRVWLKRRARETDLTFTNTKKVKGAGTDINVGAFIEEHKRFLDALIVIR